MLVLVLSQTSGTMDFRTAEGESSKYGLWHVDPGTQEVIAESRHPLIVSRPGKIACDLRFPEGLPFGRKLVFEVLSELFKLVQGVLVTLQAHFEGSETTPA